MPALKILGANNRKIINEKLQTCIDPLSPTDHPQNIINIATGQIALPEIFTSFREKSGNNDSIRNVINLALLLDLILA